MSFPHPAPYLLMRIDYPTDYVLVSQVRVSQCNQARYLHQFLHHLRGGGCHPHAARRYKPIHAQISHYSCKPLLAQIKVPSKGSLNLLYHIQAKPMPIRDALLVIFSNLCVIGMTEITQKMERRI